ncbi:hypothetical protein [Neorhizobium sp. DAR64861/K0K2]|uniref:hypothetical protein n=1 Tax=unclassified Neorhizobium TaxID=2629175 RepID=UPI003D2DE174
MQGSGYDDAWWIALALPLGISFFIFQTSWALRATRRKFSLTFTLNEQRNAHISSVTTSTLTVWNDGTELIEATSFARNSPLTIKLDGANVFRSEVIRVSRPENEVLVQLPIGDNRLQVQFDFLAPGEGFRWQGDHDGAPGLLRLEGWIKGASSPLLRYRAISPQLKAGAIFVLLGVWYELVFYGTNLLIHEGVRSWMFLTWLPFPIFAIAGSAIIVGSLANEWRNPGPRLLRAWEREAVRSKLPQPKA